MGKGGNKSEWQLKVDNAYKQWKYNDLHRNIKNHFNGANSRDEVPSKLRELVKEDSEIIADLKDLSGKVEKEKENVKERLFVRDSSSNVQFLGAKIEVPENDVDDEEVSLKGYSIMVSKILNPFI